MLGGYFDALTNMAGVLTGVTTPVIESSMPAIKVRYRRTAAMREREARLREAARASFERIINDTRRAKGWT